MSERYPQPQEPFDVAVPPSRATEWLESRGIKPGFSYLDVWLEEHSKALTAAKLMSESLLQTVRDAVNRASDRAESFAEFREQLEPVLVEAGWWGVQDVTDPKTGRVVRAQLGSKSRLKLIYEQNLRTARAVGHWELVQDGKKDLPYLLYTLGPSRVHRDAHVALEGTLLPVDHPFWGTHMPPNGWNCRCDAIQLSQRDIEAEGLVVSPDPVLKRVPYRNRRTGKRHIGYEGVDPGFEFNPGAVGLRELKRKMRGM